MKNSLSDLYEQILLKEAEKSALQSPTNDEVGKLDTKQDLFGETPKPVEGPEKAKLQQGPSYKQTTGTSSAPKDSSSFKGTAPAKETKAEAPKEVKDEEVDPEKDKEDKKKKEKHEESFTMSAFETLFKKTIVEELNEEPNIGEETVNSETETSLEDSNNENEETNLNDETNEEDEGDLISDLKELQDKLSTILAKLEDVAEEGEGHGEEGEESYTEEEFDEEFDNEEEQEDEEEHLKESSDKAKILSPSKGKGLTSKKNKVGKLSAKGGKAHGGVLKNEPTPKALGDKKAHLQKGGHVKSNITKGEFFK